MAKEIPNIEFRSKHQAIEGLDILRIEDLRTLDSSKLNHDPQKAHQLEFNILIFFTQGNTEHLVDFVSYDVNKNTVLHLSKGQINAFKFNDEVKGFIIPFTENYLKKQLNKLPNTELVRLFNSHLFSPKIQLLQSSNVKSYIELLYHEFHVDLASVNKQKVCDNLFTIIFSKLEQLKQYQTFHIKESERLATFLKFRNLVSANYMNSRNADFYASKLNITYKHLNEVCKEIVHTTAKNFIDEYVILEAQRRLINSSVKSNELAFQLGFQEPTNFIKYFKKNTGFTPNTFKKKYK